MQASKRITKKSASNLAFSFILLPREKRNAMSVLYAFCREVDDIADDEQTPPAARKEKLDSWRADIKAVLEEKPVDNQVCAELATIIRKYNLPAGLFMEIISGVEMDVFKNRYSTFDELETYCFKVASAVGLLSLEIFGYSDAKSKDYAIALGKALQLTNILRDVAEDAKRNRVYFPETILNQAGCPVSDILLLKYSPEFAAAAKLLYEYALRFYTCARATLPDVDKNNLIAAEFMADVYWQLLKKIQKVNFNVFDRDKIRLNFVEKLKLLTRTFLSFNLGIYRSKYGAN